MTMQDMMEHLLGAETLTAEGGKRSNSFYRKHRTSIDQRFKSLTPTDRVTLARHQKRPNVYRYIDALCTDFVEMHGDRLQGDDPSILTGIALFHGQPVTIIAHRKGNTLEQNVQYNFGMPKPAGYRKAQRAIRQAEKFHRPIVTFIDTPGAYPGMDAEENGQGEAIASTIQLLSHVSVPVIAVVIGEGGSGGALALGVANRVVMLENAIYAILSPEGFATILWKDVNRRDEAAEMMKLTAQDLLQYKVCDKVIPEGVGSVILNFDRVAKLLDRVLTKELARLNRLSPETLVEQRYQRFRGF